MKNFKSHTQHCFFCLIIVLSLLSGGNLFSQRANIIATGFISPDSLIGFEEQVLGHEITARGYSGIEYQNVMAKLKRDFLIKKYNLVNPFSFGNRPVFPTNPVASTAPCVNEDFELGNTSGWTITSGTNPFSPSGGACANLTLSTAGSPECAVVTTPLADTYLGTLPNSPLGGTKVVKLNDVNPSNNIFLVTRISQTFPVTSSNALFQFVYAGAWNGSGHACCDQPYLKITLKNCAGTPLACPTISLTPSGAACTSGVTGYTVTSGISWTNWKLRSLDLTPYIGSCITIEVTNGDCNGGAHFGYTYFDAICLPMTINVNNTPFPAGTTAATVVSCGVSTATLVAPPGLGPYSWTGPAGSGISNNTNQTIQTVTGGSYTLTMNPPGSCAPIIKVVTLQFAPTPDASFTNGNSCNSFTFNNTGNAPPAIQTYSFIGTSPPGNFTTTATNTTVVFPAAGTYTVIHVIDNSGCTATVQAIITVPPPQNPAFTVPTPTQCLNGNSYSFVAANPAGTQSYTFNPSAGAPAVGNSANYGPGSFTAPGTYTVTHSVTNGGCTAVTNSVISISPQPSLTLIPTNALCGNNNGSIQINNTSPAGQTVISYSLNGTATTSLTINGLGAGAYTAALTNNFGCVTSSVTNIINTPGITALATSAINPACGNSAGSITLGAVTGGSAPYTFNVNGGPFSSSPPLTGLPAGTYTIIVKDVNNCTFTKIVTLTNTPAPTAITFTTSPTACVGNTGVLGITGVTGGTPAYTYSVNGVGTGAVTNNLAVGPKTITVSDANGCTYTTTATIPIVSGPTSANIAVTAAACGNPNGSATVTSVTGGAPAYQYSFNGGPFSSSTVQGGMLAGPKSVVVQDANSCTLTVNFTIGNTGSPSSAIATLTNVSCFNGSNGGFSLTTTGGTPGYNYTLTPGNITSGFGTFTGLTAGAYTINVKDALGCVTTVITSITQPAQITLSTAMVPPPCFGGTNGTITATAGGGTSPYVYNINGGPNQASNTFTNNISAGAYNITVIDNLGCTTSQTISVTQPPQIVLALTSSPANCSSPNGSASVTATGGTPIYSYTWSPAGGNNPLTTGIAAGSYTVIVKDTKNCSVTGVISVTATPGGTAVVTNTSNVTCNGLNNGSLTANMIGNVTAPLTYSWSNGPITQTDGPLAPGNYTVTVTDFYGCKSNAVGTVTQPSSITVTAAGSPALCFGGATGSASVIASGGTPAYSYLWSPGGSTASTASGLNAGTYSIQVTDANNCVQTRTITITQPTSVTINTSTITAACGQPNGGATVTATGGTPAYTYTWSTSVTGPVLNNVPAGAYTVQVKDGNGCLYTGAAVVPNASGPTIGISSFTNPSCFGSTNGIATTTMSGGTAGPGFPTYSWSNGQNTGTATNLQNGVYTVTLTDAAGCHSSATVTMVQPQALTVTVSGINPKCFNATNGTANAGVLGGTGPYTYAWLPAPGAGGTTATPSGMGPGTYNVTITDSHGCTIPGSTTLGNPPQMLSSISSTNLSCFNLCNGSAVASVTNAIGAVSYYWTGGPSPLTTQNVNNLCAGTYTMLATDQNTCTATTLVTINQPPLLTVSLSAVGSVSCSSGNNGFATAAPNGGTPTYSYTWSNGQTTATSNSLTAGNYTVTITDTKGCTASTVATITQPAGLTVVATKTNAPCFGTNGIGNISYSGGTGIPSILWQPNLAVTQNVSIPAGSYTVTLNDANNCPASATLTITQPPVLTAVIPTVVPTNCGQANGSSSVTAGGGAGGYTYQWSSSPSYTNATITSVVSGPYTVTVKDVNNCSVTTATFIPNIAAPVVVVTNTVPVVCFGQANGGATITVTGGAGGNTYLWSYLAQTTQNVNNLPSGLHSISVTDVAGCVGGAIVNITQPTQLVTAVGSVTNVSCSGNANGAAQILAVGGTTNYAYLWTPSAQTNSVLTGVNSGTYVCLVTDANGCPSSKTVTITQPNPLIITTNTVVPNNCFNFATGQINTSISGGTPTYTLNWATNNATLTLGPNPVITNLTGHPNTYTLVVTDVQGCSTNSVYTLTDPTPLVVGATPTTQATCGNSNGTATVNITGGSPAYVYNWNTPVPQTSPVATGLPPGTWALTTTDSKGCVINTTININAAALPSVTAVSNNVLCFGQANGSATVTASGVGGFTYSWTPTGLTSAVVNGLTGPTTYTAKITDLNGCVTYTTVNISQPNQLVLNVSPTQTICYGTAATIYGQAGGGSTPYNYTFTDLSSNITSTLSTPNGFNATPTLTSTTQYTMMVVDNNGCSDGPKNILVSVLAPLGVTAPSFTTCAANSVTLTASATGGFGPGYSWSNGANNAVTTVTANYAANNPALNPNTYTVIVDDHCSIPTASAVVHVTVYPAPNVSYTPLMSKGCAPLTVTYHTDGDSTTTNNQPFIWDFTGVPEIQNPYANPQIITYTQAGTYSLNLITVNKYGCAEQIEYQLAAQVYPVPIAGFYPSSQSASLMEPTINFINTSTGASQYVWDFGDYSFPATNASSAMNPSHLYSYVGNYQIYLVAIDSHQCKDTATATIEIKPDMGVYIPNTFTPDGNGRNDVFLPYGYGIKEDNYKMEIFDRWGELIFTSSEFRKGWDGSVKGSDVSKNGPAQDDVYIYKIMITDLNNNKKNYVGHVTLIKQ